MYHFTQLAIEMNELDHNVAQTDSRFRPDQRLMEEAKWDEADEKKIFLEDKQRQRLNIMKKEPSPIWFEMCIDPYTSEEIYVFKKEYWACKARQDWSKCPNLYE